MIIIHAICMTSYVYVVKLIFHRVVKNRIIKSCEQHYSVEITGFLLCIVLRRPKEDMVLKKKI